MTNNSIPIIDLHTHSIASDGSYTPTQLIESAKQLDLKAIALTDHDTIGGLDEFMQAAKVNNIIGVPGVEISVILNNKELHILGLFIDYHSESFTNMLCELRKNRNLRNEKIIEKLQNLNYDISLDEVLEIAGGDSVGRPLFAKILIEKGYFKEAQEVFDKCLKRGQPGFVNRILPTPTKAISEIHNAGGLAVWAHPVFKAKNQRSFVRNSLKKLKLLGLDGVETYYTSFSEEQNNMMINFANEYELLQSGGSDFHGDNHPKVKLGVGYGDLKIPAQLYQLMIDKLG